MRQLWFCGVLFLVPALVAQTSWRREQGARPTVSRQLVATPWGMALGQMHKGSKVWLWDGTKSFQTKNSPPWGGRLVYDPKRRKLLALVEVATCHPNLSCFYTHSTWSYDGKGWRQESNKTRWGGSLYGRQQFGLAYHARTGTVVMFGGQSNGVRNQTLVWDGKDWMLLKTKTAPSARKGPAMATEPSGDVLMFGGFDGRNRPFGDTWRFDGKDWAKLQPKNSPPASGPSGMTLDTVRQRIVLFDGRGGTWDWDGVNWWVRSVNSPGKGGARLAFYKGRTYMKHLYVSPSLYSFQTDKVANVKGFGAGCKGSFGTPVLTSSTRPWLADFVQIDATNLGTGSRPVVLVAGFSNTTWLGAKLPLDLSKYGLPGCKLHASVDRIFQGIASSNGLATVRTPVPAVRRLAGLSIYLQAFVRDQNGRFAVSNGLQLTLGRR